mmetsp:Transcript_187/g.762  ORF Transcript_187/g.762 Transcript_187/m.762 type:complete len:935 (-) Transcript_187:62-2866(-)
MAEAKPYEWSQTDSEVAVRFPMPAAAGKDIKVKTESSHLTVSLAGKSVFKQELANKVEVDDCFWALEGADESRTLVITLCKKKDKMQWRGLTKEEEEQVPGPDVMAPDFDVMGLEHDDDDPERVEEQEQNEIKLEARYKKLLEEKGLQDESTLQTFFALFDNCIQLYRLNKLHTYLRDVLPECRKRTDKYKLKAVQAMAFVLWKQSKFKEALPLFHEMEDILGKGAALCENIAHTYNSMGNYDKAEDYFRQALKFIEQEHGLNRGNRGGVLLGLGLVRDRLGKHREALPVIKQAYDFYKERANGAPASLQAKAGISCAKLHAKLGEMEKAEVFIREAVMMYEVTCGETSPLTASAYHELGKCLWAQRKREDAQKALARAYELESMKDAWDLVTLLEIHNTLMDTHLKDTTNINRTKFQEYFKTTEFVTGRVRKNLPQDGNAAVYYKAAGELKSWGGKYSEAKELFNEAIPLFQKEKAMDCSGLIAACRDMLSFCDRNLAGQQNSPMNFDVPTSKEESLDEPYDGPVFEEVQDDDENAAMEEVVRAAIGAGTSSSSAAPVPSPREYRLAAPGDFEQALRLCAECGRTPLLADQAGFTTHLQGSGAGLCWAAVSSGRVVGFAVCGSDGIHAHVQQLLSSSTVGGRAEEELRHGLLERCAEACREKGLRGLRAEPSVAGERGGELFEALSWKASHFVYGSPATVVEEAPAAAATPAAAASSSSSSSAAKPAAPKDLGTWAKVDVEKELVADEGVDPSIVPEKVIQKEDFGPEGQGLELPTKITKYSWDQTKANVSLYIPFDGVGSLPEGDIVCVFRPRGVLLVISHAGKRHWYKVPNLCTDIDTEASGRKLKSDHVVIKLRKAEQGREWSALDDSKERYNKDREFRLQHGDLKGASTEQLLADMYKNANDEERAGLRDAMRVNQEKRKADANPGKGA